MYKPIKVGLHIKKGLKLLILFMILKVTYGPKNQNLKWGL